MRIKIRLTRHYSRRFLIWSGVGVVALAAATGGGIYAYQQKVKNDEAARQADLNAQELALKKQAEETRRVLADRKERERKAAIENPMYAVVHEDSAQVLVYQPEEKKFLELFTVEGLDENFKYYANFDYSSVRNQVVYSDSKGIALFDVATRKTTRLLSHKEIDQKSQYMPEMRYSETYSDPKWRPDGQKITYRIGYYEGSAYALMDPDGKNIVKIENEGGYEPVWSPDSTAFVTGGSAGMASTDGLYVNTDGKFTKTKQILPKKSLGTTYSPVWSADGSTLTFTYVPSSLNGEGTYQERTNLASIGKDGKNLAVLLNDKDRNQYPFYGADGKLYFSKASGPWDAQKGKGIYVWNDEAKKSDLYYADGNRAVYPVGGNKEYMVVSTPNSLKSYEALVSLRLISYKDKAMVPLGEAGKMEYAGFIVTKNLPTGLPEVKAPTPTDKEKTAYENSLKSHGYPYQTYYDYCWDFDCQSKTYAYPKLSKSAVPEIITLNSKPAKLAGDVKVPAIFVYVNDPFKDEELALARDAGAKGSPASMQAWLNEQAKQAGQNLTFEYLYQPEPIKLSDLCLNAMDYKRADGSSYKNYSLDPSCLKLQIMKKYTDLGKYPAWQILFRQAKYVDASTPSYVNLPYGNTADSDGIKIAFGDFGSPYYSSIAEYQKSSLNSPFWFRPLLNLYGAKSKLINDSSRQAVNGSLCAVDPREDVMCMSYLEGPSYKTVPYDTLKIAEITRKELGWYDGDGDKVNEVDDPCPFDKANTCKKP